MLGKYRKENSKPRAEKVGGSFQMILAIQRALPSPSIAATGSMCFCVLPPLQSNRQVHPKSPQSPRLPFFSRGISMSRDAIQGCEPWDIRVSANLLQDVRKSIADWWSMDLMYTIMKYINIYIYIYEKCDVFRFRYAYSLDWQVCQRIHSQSYKIRQDRWRRDPWLQEGRGGKQGLLLHSWWQGPSCMQVSFELDAATQGPIVIGLESCSLSLMSFLLQTLVWFHLLYMHLYWCDDAAWYCSHPMQGHWADTSPASSRWYFCGMFNISIAFLFWCSPSCNCFCVYV